MKRLLSIFFILCLVVALSLSVSAESTKKLTYAVGASAPTVSANTEFTILVDITENTGICWLKTVITYDSAVLSYVDASTDSSAFDTTKLKVQSTDGKVIIEFNNILDIMAVKDPVISTATGRFIALTFKAKPATLGDTTVSIASTSDAIYKSNGVNHYDVEITLASATVRIVTNEEHTCVAGAEVRENEVAPNCSTMGSYDAVTYCTACGTEMSRKTVVVPFNEDHAPGEPEKENVVAATCSTAETYDLVTRCTRCNKILGTESKTGEKTDHTAGTPEVKYTPSTCIATGTFVEIYKCKFCGIELNRNTNELPLADHVAGSPEIKNEKPATCSAKGSYDSVVSCSVCDKVLSTETVITDKISHSPAKAVEENRVPAKDCLTPGSYDFVIYCSVCKEELSREKIAIPVLAHTPGNPPTETDPQVCTVCGYVIFPAIGHTHKWSETMTSNQDGHWYACEGCETKKDYAAHTYDNQCDEECNACGFKRVVPDHVYDNDCDEICNYCSDKRTAPHSYDHACDATCNLCGATRAIAHQYDNNCDASCNICGAMRTPADHVFGSWNVVTEPTAEAAGLRERACNVCGKKETEELPATDTPDSGVVTEDPSVGTTDAPAVSTDGEGTTDPSEDTEPDKPKNGCKSAVSFGVAFIAILGTALIMKKRD